MKKKKMGMEKIIKVEKIGPKYGKIGKKKDETFYHGESNWISAEEKIAYKIKKVYEGKKTDKDNRDDHSQNVEDKKNL